MSANENESLQKNELITKLEEISALYRDTVAIKTEMDSFVPEDNYDRKIIVPKFPGKYEDDEDRETWVEAVDHRDKDSVKEIAKFYDEHYCPQKPSKPKLKDFEKPDDSSVKAKQSQFGCLSYIVAIVGGLFGLSIVVNLSSGVFVGFVPIMLVVVSALLFLFFRYKIREEKKNADIKNSEALIAHTHRQEELLAEYNTKMEVYESECTSYKVARQDFLDAYSEWRVVYIKHLKEEEAIKEKLEEDSATAIKKILEEQYIPAKDKLDASNDLISERYLPALNTIIELLKSNRADDLKEAINLYEEIVYRERQLKLQREQEEQRKREEQQRRYEEQIRRTREERHQREEEAYQGWQRQYEEWDRKQEEERQYQKEMQQERNRQREEERRREQDPLHQDGAG